MTVFRFSRSSCFHIGTHTHRPVLFQGEGYPERKKMASIEADIEFRFNGTVDLEILEASNIKPITITGGRVLAVFDSYVVVDFDEVYFCKTVSKPKTVNPTWREHFTEDVTDAEMMTFTLFHKAVVPPDPFIAHARIPVEELVTSGKEMFEVRICSSHFLGNR